MKDESSGPKVKNLKVDEATHERMTKALRGRETFQDLINRLMDQAGMPPLAKQAGQGRTMKAGA